MCNVLPELIPRRVPSRPASQQPAQLNAFARQTSMEVALKDSNVSLVLRAASLPNKRLHVLRMLAILATPLPRPIPVLFQLPLTVVIVNVLRTLMAHSHPTLTWLLDAPLVH